MSEAASGAQSEAAQHLAAQHEAAQHEAAQHEAVQHEAAEHEVVVRPAGPGADVLARATRLLREAPEPGWGEVADRLRTRLRTVSRPGRPLTVREDGAGVVQVDSRVVVDAVRRAVATLPDTRAVGVVVDTDGPRAVSVRVDVAVRYGTDVRLAADAARERTHEVLRTVLGVATPVDVTVVDVLA